jgi:hypothetical protein
LSPFVIPSRATSASPLSLALGNPSEIALFPQRFVWIYLGTHEFSRFG